MAVEYRILIVDDDPDVASSYKMLLPVEIETRLTARAGLARLADRTLPPIHCVVLDLTLPNGQGIDLVKRFLREAPQVPVVVLTGHLHDAKSVQAAGPGVRGFFTKPADHKTLTDVIIRAIAEHHVECCLGAATREAAGIVEEIDAATARRRRQSDSSILRPQRLVT